MSMIRQRQDFAIKKETRWNRIRKRHGNNMALGSSGNANVKRFIEMDFIGKQAEKMLIKEQKENTLNPALVMDMRHEMFQQIPRSLPLATLMQRHKLDACKSHNLMVEQRYIENELQKFRAQLAKHQMRSNFKVKNNAKLYLEKQQQKDTELRHSSALVELSNANLLQSLQRSSKCYEDFYKAPLEALEQLQQRSTLNVRQRLEQDIEQTLQASLERQVNVGTDLEIEQDEAAGDEEAIVSPNTMAQIEDILEEIINIDAGKSLNNSMNAVVEQLEPGDEELELQQLATTAQQNEQQEQTVRVEEKRGQLEIAFGISRNTPSPLTPTDEWLQQLRQPPARCVQFDEQVQVKQFKRQHSNCSNTSDGIDSVISDIAAEALLELEMEMEQKTDGDGCIASNIQVEGTALNNKLDPQQLLLVQQLEISTVVQRQNWTNIELSNSSSDHEDNASISNQEQNHIVDELFKEKTAHAQQKLLKHYFLRWIHYTTIEKIEREQLTRRCDRARKINAFLDNVRKEKTRRRVQQQQQTATEPATQQGQAKQRPSMEAVQMTKKYQTKIKIQQDIIELQRLKLERQERMLMELKLSRLSDEQREARQELKQELKAVIRTGDAKTKAKAKCLQIIGNLRDEEDKSVDELRVKALATPKFLLNMQERALERGIRHEQARQRRLQQEAEREAQKMAMEEAKRLEDEEAKRMRIEMLKEKRRQEKMAKIIKERERQRAIENNRKAQQFARRLLLKRVGMEGFKRLLQRKRDNLRKCEQLRRNIFKRSYYGAWRDYYKTMQQQRELLAVKCRQRSLQRNALLMWKDYYKEQQSKWYVAMMWHELKLSEAIFARWLTWTKRMLQQQQNQMTKAAAHHEWQLKWKVLDCWQRLKQILQLEYETEERRQRWRMKIWELLPDYKPNRDTDFLLD